jgi:hypothetical protein
MHLVLAIAPFYFYQQTIFIAIQHLSIRHVKVEGTSTNKTTAW